MRKVHTDLASRRTTYAPWNQPAILPAEGARSAYTRSICSSSSNIESAGLFARSLVVHSRDGLSAGGNWIRTSSSAPDRQQFRSFVRDGHALLGAATCQPRRDEAAAKIARRVGASDLKRVLSPVAAAEVIPTEARQAFEHAGGTADRKIALLTQGYGVIRVLRPI